MQCGEAISIMIAHSLDPDYLISLSVYCQGVGAINYYLEKENRMV